MKTTIRTSFITGLVMFLFGFTFAQTPCGELVVTESELGYGFVGESVYVRIRPEPNIWDPIQYSVVSLPPGVQVFNYQQGDLSLTLAGSIITPGTHVFSIAASSSNGCDDTLTFTKTYVCIPEQDYHLMTPWPEELSQAKVGVPFEQQFSPAIYYEINPSLFRFHLLAGALPAGLTLEDTGRVSGTPTSAGDYNFTLSASIGECLYVKSNYVLHVAPAALKSLYINSLCSESDHVRNWQIHNPNTVNVEVVWETLYYESHTGSLIAIPGDNFFTTPMVGGPNTIRITWPDGAGTKKIVVKASINTLCNPPSRVVATSVDFYHQGLQKDGNRIPTLLSNPKNALGEPDANDAADGGSRAFSLGYNGFIILQLNAPLVDQPGNDLIVYEYSNNNPSFFSYPERAEVFAAMHNDWIDGWHWVSLGLTSPAGDCNQKLDTEFDLAGKIAWCRYIKIVDVTYRHARISNSVSCSPTSVFAFNNASNGFDVDALTGIQTINKSNDAARATDAATSTFDELSETTHAAIYPNPTSGPLVIDLSQEQEFVIPEGGEIELIITDLNGVQVYKQIHQLDEWWTITCNIDSLQPGLLIAKVKAGFVTRYFKLMKN